MIVRVAIVGCGNIGAQWDYSEGGRSHSLSHTAGFSRQPGAELCGLCDIDMERARKAADRWGGEAFADFARMIDQARPDLLVIAGPTAERSDCIDLALARGVKFFVIEKPLAHDLTTAQTIEAKLRGAGARALVNFSRRWDPAMTGLRHALADGQFGTMQRIAGFYGKGIANNGSHMVDLAAFLLDAVPVSARALGSPLAGSESDWSPSRDPALDAEVIYRHPEGRETQLTMIGTDQQAMTLFEMRLLLQSAVIDIRLGGRDIEIRSAVPDDIYPGYLVPSPPRKVRSGLLDAMDLMAQDAIAMVRGDRLRSPLFAEGALITATTVEAILTSQTAGGRWIDVRVNKTEGTV